MAEKTREVKHIGVILDGNRRYAKLKAMNPWDGHKKGADNVNKLMGWAIDLGIHELTLYAFSMQNFKRDKKEVDFLMKIFKDLINKLLKSDDPKLKNVRFNFIGRINLFPKDIYEKMLKIMNKTKKNSKLTVNFAMAYGGQEEIVDAVKKIAEEIKEDKIKVEEISKELIEENLYLQNQPDFIIRTGGDHRTSNFLIWQSWYSEWFFPKKFWPEFTKEDLIDIIDQFKNRERRFGK